MLTWVRSVKAGILLKVPSESVAEVPLKKALELLGTTSKRARL